ncbi:MAG: OmpA family protein [Candidatus Thioglobus sp.]|nr:MAG: OmpA family protein [Candidatus Thioglobus sp.]KAA0454963.1 MAG: OmpA family protein [Candidatus Thioglobus sp.]
MQNLKTPITLLLLSISLSACFVDKNAAAIIEDQKPIDAIIGGQSSFEWKQNQDSFSKLPAMPEQQRQAAVAQLATSGVDSVLYFDYDTAKISPAAISFINKHAQFMRKYPAIRLRLEGHTDPRGTRDYNLALGENRALVVKSAMEKSGKNIANKIQIISYGEEKSQSGTDESNYNRDRRVQFIYK